MKKLLLAAFLLTGLFGNAQDDKMSEKDKQELEKGMKMLFSSEISMDIDKTVFTMNEGNTYFTEDQKSGIIAMAVPQSYEKMKEKLEQDKPKAGMQQLEKGELELGGQKVLFTKSLTKKEGEEFIVIIYGKKHDAESCIMISSFFEKSKEKQMQPMAEKAIASAKLTK